MRKLFLLAIILGVNCFDGVYSMTEKVEKEQIGYYDKNLTDRFWGLLHDQDTPSDKNKTNEVDDLAMNPKVDVNQQDENGDYPLFAAYRLHSKNVMSDCFLHLTNRRTDIDINVQDSEGNTLLHMIFADGLAGFLSDVMGNKKADVYKRNKNGKFPWEMVSEEKNRYNTALMYAVALLKDRPTSRQGWTPKALAERFFRTYSEGYRVLSKEVLDVCGFTEIGYKNTEGFDPRFNGLFMQEAAGIFAQRRKEGELLHAFIRSGADVAMVERYENLIPNLSQISKMEDNNGYTLMDVAYEEKSELWRQWCLKRKIPSSGISLKLAVNRGDSMMVYYVLEAHKDEPYFTSVKAPSTLDNATDINDLIDTYDYRRFLLQDIRKGNIETMWYKSPKLFDEHLEEALECANKLQNEGSEDLKNAYKQIAQKLEEELQKRYQKTDKSEENCQ